MLETFDMHKGGKECRRLVAGFGRIFGATTFFGADRFAGPAKLVQRSRFNFLREARSDATGLQMAGAVRDFENVIVLSDGFHQEVTAHPVPPELEAVKLLADTAAVLDLFVWLSFAAM